MARPCACFFTVCGGGEDYDFLLGAIEHHAQLGMHVVLDTTPESQAKQFINLPPTVTWVHEPIYGNGWENFRCRSAVARAAQLAEQWGPDLLVYLDSDEFFSRDSVELLFPLAAKHIVEVETVHFKKDGRAYAFGPSEWHRRLWPARRGVEIAVNQAWQRHPCYNGNPELHPYANGPWGMKVIRAPGHYHYHLHFALGRKAEYTRTAEDTITGWKDGGTPVYLAAPWPVKLRLWRDSKIPPSTFFS